LGTTYEDSDAPPPQLDEEAYYDDGQAYYEEPFLNPEYEQSPFDSVEWEEFEQYNGDDFHGGFGEPEPEPDYPSHAYAQTQHTGQAPAHQMSHAPAHAMAQPRPSYAPPPTRTQAYAAPQAQAQYAPPQPQQSLPPPPRAGTPAAGGPTRAPY